MRSAVTARNSGTLLQLWVFSSDCSLEYLESVKSTQTMSEIELKDWANQVSDIFVNNVSTMLKGSGQFFGTLLVIVKV